jgi:surfeit locus 1 family protein
MTRFRLVMWPALATFMALGILLALGFWQLARKVEKETQLTALQQALTSTPLTLDGRMLQNISVLTQGPTATDDAISELTRVTLTGEYIPGRTVPVRITLPATKGGATSGIGFFFMTPLRTASGQIVFINRGFAPSGGDWKAPAIATPEGQQTITGLMRKPEIKSTFMPADNPAKGEYFSRDPKIMAAAVSLQAETIAPFFIDQERTAGNLTPPVGVDPKEMIARIPNNHLQYAVTWFGFAATLVIIFILFARARIRSTHEQSPSG